MDTPSTETSARSLRVLVAEDDDDLRALLVETLEHEGHRAVELEDGYELSDYVEVSKGSVTGRIRPDVIITDVRMPGRSGLEAARKAREAGLDCPIIVITALPDPAVRQAAEELGGTVFVEKPVDVREIAELVARVSRG